VRPGQLYKAVHRSRAPLPFESRDVRRPCYRSRALLTDQRTRDVQLQAAVSLPLLRPQTLHRGSLRAVCCALRALSTIGQVNNSDSLCRGAPVIHCVLFGSIYLSNFGVAGNVAVLHLLGITHVLNCTQDCPFADFDQAAFDDCEVVACCGS
jgi:hypothetical protein